jgi:hypothetical protein
MISPSASAPKPIVVRFMLVSAIVMFGLGLAIWNEAFSFLVLDDVSRRFLTGALLAGGLFDVGVAILLSRRAR